MSRKAVIGYGIGLGVSALVFAGSISTMIYGVSDCKANPGISKVEKIYRNNPDTNIALDYLDISDELDETARGMEDWLLVDESEIMIIKSPYNEGIKGNIERSVQELVDLKTEDKYAKELVEIYTRIDELDSEYTKVNSLETKEAYGEEYQKIKDDLEKISEEIDLKALEYETNLEKILKTISTMRKSAVGSSPGLILGATGTVVLFVHLVVELPEYLRSTKRKRNKP